MAGIEVGVVDRIAVIALSNPPRNALTRETAVRLDEALGRIAGDPGVRAVVVRGAGEGAFSVGSDLVEMQEARNAGRPVQDILDAETAAFSRLAALTRPTVAAVEGVALGAGLELAVACDFIVAGAGASFGLPEIRLGAIAGSGGPMRVTRRIGAARAKEMMLLGDPVDAETALAWGLVSRKVAAGTAFAEAKALALRLADGPAVALARTKHLIDTAGLMGDADGLALSRRYTVEIAGTGDNAAGLEAFFAKRRPVFTDPPPAS
jgi:enoyl-CoA hydratase/carnithine racemase